MKKLLSANFSRLLHSKLYWLGMAFMFGLATFAVVSRYGEIRDGIATSTTGDGFVFLGGVYVGIVIAVFISMFIGTEYNDGTIRNKLTVGHSRLTVYVANLIVTVVASLAMHLVYIGVIFGGSMLFLDPFTVPARLYAVLLLCGVVTVVAMASLFQLIAMLISSKATGAIVSMILALVLLFGAMTLISRLDSPEFFDGFTYSVELDEMVYVENIVNVTYVDGLKRDVYQFLLDFFPSGQMIQFGNFETVPNDVIKYPMYSLMLTLITTAAGVFVFRRKDLK